MKNFMFCSCLALSLFNGDCWGMQKSESAPELGKPQKIEVRPRSNSFPSAILSEMKSGELQFKEIEYPKILDKYKGVPEVENIKERLLEIAKLGMKDPKKLFELAAQLTGEDGEREDIYGVLGNEIFSIDSLRDMILERVVEAGCYEAISCLSAQFCSLDPSIRAQCAGFIKYDGHNVSPKLLYVAGQYLDQLYGYKKYPRLYGDPNSILYKIRSKISQNELPKEKYLSWALRNASNDTAALALAP